MEAVNRDNIAVLTYGETWGRGRYTEEGDTEDTATGVGWLVGVRSVDEDSYKHKVAIGCN